MANAISVPVDPQPTASQITGIGLIAQLMDPTYVLIAQFRNDGYVMLSFSQLVSGKYSPYQLLTLPPGTPVSFEFGVDVGTDPNKPLSGLMIERADDWATPWDDEVAHVLGGKSFPFGSDPVPLAGSINPNVAPQNILKGVFKSPPTGSSISELTINGISRTSVTKIAPLSTGTTASKSLSLWLPATTDGYMQVSLAGGEIHRYTAKSLLGQTNAKVLAAVQKEKTVKKIVPKRK
jgi:hypothetical protein